MSNKKHHLILYQQLYIKIKDECVCVYCGEQADTLDHFTPLSFASVLSQAYKTDRLFMLPACRECNLLASNKVFITVGSKRRFVQEKLEKRYRRILDSTVKWTERELSEMGDNLRSHIAHSFELKRIIERRIEWKNKGLEDVKIVLKPSGSAESGKNFVVQNVGSNGTTKNGANLLKEARPFLRKHHKGDKEFALLVFKEFGYDEALSLIKATQVIIRN